MFFSVFFVFVFFRFFYSTYVQDTFRTCLNDHVSFAQQNYHTNTKNCLKIFFTPHIFLKLLMYKYLILVMEETYRSK